MQRNTDSIPRLAALGRTLQPAIMLIAAAAVIVVLVLGVRLRAELQSYQEEPVDNIHWNVTQLELDAVRLETEAELVRVRPSSSLTELRKRYDLFYSRAQSAIKGKMLFKFGLQDVMTPMNARLQTFLTTTTPIIDSSDAILRAATPQILQDTTALRADLREMSVQIVDKYAAFADQRRAAFTALVRQVAWASGLVLISLLLLVALVLWLNRLAEGRALQTARLSSRLAATVRTSLDAIVVAGSDGRVMDFNEAASRIFGYTRDEAVGGALSDLIVPPHLKQSHENGMARMKRDGSFHVVNAGRIEIQAMRKGGIVFPVELSIASHTTDDGMIFISVLRDISERVASQSALLTARDDALAAEQAKTNFMAVMSHEMRTPLNGVMAALEIASSMAVDGKQTQFLNLAQSSARQLLRHANDVLDISKVEAGQMHLALEDFDLIDMLENLVTTFGKPAAQNGTKIVLTPLSDLPKLRGDPLRIGQIVQNFLSNAIKFTDSGTITVEFEQHIGLESAIDIEIRVIDTGIGIRDADQNRIFDDFVMVDPSYGRTRDGTGLGLAISRRLAHAMGGEVGVESALGEGSCFWVRLPVALASQKTALSSGPHTANPAGQLEVLVVEDNATNRIVLEEMLLMLGHQVTLAEDGGKGMELARARRFDAILMDISMPLMDGLTATALIRREGRSVNAQILAVTAHSMPADLQRFREAGMDGCLTKPISLTDLKMALSEGPTSRTKRRQGSHTTIDLDRLQELRDSLGETGLARILTRFHADFDNLQKRLTKACADDPSQILALCHEAAGLSAVVGAKALHAHFAKAEALCRDGHAETAARLLLDETDALWTNVQMTLTQNA